MPMTLDAYLSQQAITETSFAETLGVQQSTVNRMRKGAVPTPSVMEKVFAATGGAVTPNDFYRIPA